MGQLVMSVVGAVGGFLIGGPLGASIGMAIGSAVGGMIFGPTIKGPRLTDLRVSASTYGSVIPELYGTSRSGTNMIWTTGLIETKNSESGKGGPKVTTYNYSASFAMAVCRGPVDEILRIWGDGKLIYDVRAGLNVGLVAEEQSKFSTVVSNAKAALSKSKSKKDDYLLRIYKGTEDQLPDSLIAANKGAAVTPAYRGLCYLVFEDMKLADFANRIPAITVEVSKKASNLFPSLPALESDAETIMWKNGAVGDPIPYWAPDWEYGRMFSSDASGMRTAAMDDFVFPDQKLPIPMMSQTPGTLIAPASNYYLQEMGTQESRVTRMYDLSTGQVIADFGNAGHQGDIVVEWDEDDVCADRFWYSSLGVYGNCYIPFRAGGGRHIFCHAVKTNTVWFFEKPIQAQQVWRSGVNNNNSPQTATSLNYPIGKSTGRFIPTVMIPGRQGFDYSEILGWRANGGGLQIDCFTVPAGTQSYIDRNNCTWVGGGGGGGGGNDDDEHKPFKFNPELTIITDDTGPYETNVYLTALTDITVAALYQWGGEGPDLGPGVYLHQLMAIGELYDKYKFEFVVDAPGPSWTVEIVSAYDPSYPQDSLMDVKRVYCGHPNMAALIEALYAGTPFNPEIIVSNFAEIDTQVWRDEITADPTALPQDHWFLSANPGGSLRDDDENSWDWNAILTVYESPWDEEEDV